MEKNCKYCGVVFTPKRSTAEYCSNSHRVMAFRGGAVKGDKRMAHIAMTLFKYMAESGATADGLWRLMKTFIPPVLEIDTRPIDERILEVKDDAAFESQIGLFKRGAVIGDVFAQYKDLLPKDAGDDAVAHMPMWTSKPKVEKVQTKAETEKFVAAEMKKLADLKERENKLKGKKK